MDKKQLEQVAQDIHSPQKKVFSARIPEALLQAFKEECEEYGLRESAVIEQLMLLFITTKGD